MLALGLIGFLGGLLTGVSPCIIPVLPVIFFAGAQAAVNETAPPRESGGVGVAVAGANRTSSNTLRHFGVIGGLVLSFSVVTLTGSTCCRSCTSRRTPSDGPPWSRWSRSAWV